jgi:LmeA-like phospholipid-binding
MRRIAAILVGLIALVLIVGQLVLPGMAAQRLRDQLSRSGNVREVQVSAFPAIELLWHQADKVVIRMNSYRSNSGHLGGLLGQVGDVGTLDASATQFQAGLLTLRDATLQKRGDRLTGSAQVTESDLRAAVPILDAIQPVASGDGQLTLRGSATLLGVTATIDATVRALNGQLVVQPDIPLGGFATLTVFSNPHVAVDGVGAIATAAGFAMSADGSVR